MRHLTAAAVTIGVLSALALVSAAAEESSPAVAPAVTTSPTTAPSTSFDPTTDYDVRQIEGWRIVVNRHLLENHPKTAASALQLLQFQLYQIERKVPAPAVAKLRQISIWMEFREGHHPCMCYHPDANWLRDNHMNPDKAHCVEIADAVNFLQWTHEQPWMVMHELAHGYHDQFLPAGFENGNVLSAYRHAMDSKLYESVLYVFGQHERAYATTNQQEYFAELTEAFFGTNDFYPFVRGELKEHDPVGFEMMRKAWDN